MTWYDYIEIRNISNEKYLHLSVSGRMYLKEGDEVEVQSSLPEINGQWFIDSTGNDGRSFYLVHEWNGRRLSVHSR